jgi:hypothetical protein
MLGATSISASPAVHLLRAASATLPPAAVAIPWLAPWPHVLEFRASQGPAPRRGDARSATNAGARDVAAQLSSLVRSGTDFRPVSDFCCRSPPAGLRMQRRGPRRRGGRSRRCRSRRQSGGRANHEREMRGSCPEVTEPGGRAGGCSARKTTARRACRRVVGRLAAPTHGRPRSPLLLRQGPAF